MDEARTLVEKKYGLIVTNIEEMSGYDDRNYKIETKHSTDNPNIEIIWPHGYVLKIINYDDSTNTKLIDARNCLMLHLKNNKINVPIPVLNKEGQSYSLEEFKNTPGKLHAIVLLTFLPGSTLADNKHSSQLYKNIGKYLAETNIALENFHHEAYNEYKSSLWCLENVYKIRKCFYVVKDKQQLAIVEQHLNNFEQKVLPIISTLEKGQIHGDFNIHNILVEGEEIKALLDFGDSYKTAYLFEIAICICYMIMHAKDICAGGDIITGYLKRRELTDVEKSLIKICVCARLCQSLVLGLHFYETYKSNYVLSSQENGWYILNKLTACDEETIKRLWKL
ncbi:hypothetical protein O3M35_008358 [Rhynocoris fuscipes]|uniref:Hydroxylysine kinase n=1 Tax=Rhynocoris fuscipes TaxID=488301 RepID=A0AAW1D790_9HEMI